MNGFTERLKANASETADRLNALLPNGDGDYASTLYESMRYSVLAGGKRLRAHLVLEFCALCGGERAVALPYACGIEMMHGFSLIHDDLPCMDNDDLRHGKPTNHKIYGEATALLAGDALSLFSVETVSSNPLASAKQNLEAVRCLSKNAGVSGMCGGQQIDLQSEQKTVSQSELEALVDEKTGALFATACVLGCIAANATEHQKEQADRFGRMTGLAFQITDDLLDRHSTASALGKTPGKDEKSGKSTFPALLGEEEAKAYAQTLCAQAKECLNVFPDGEAKEALCAYCDYITVRNY